MSMSMLLEPTTVTHASTVSNLAAGGLIDWGNQKTGQVGGLFRGLSAVIGIGFVIWQGVKAHGAIARIIMAGLAAGVFVWIVFNVTSLKDRVGTEVNSMAPTSVQVHHSPVDASPPTHLVLLD